MSIKPLSLYKPISAVRDTKKNQQLAKKNSEIRAAVRIVVVDDEKFTPRKNLESYGYVIAELPDITSIERVADYDIVLCDLMGVGQHFDQTLGGASLIKEIKESYPTKYIIAYTGARANAAEAKAALEYADKFLKKDVDISTWVSELDAAIDYVTDPYERWLAVRKSLLSAEIDLHHLVKLEDAYVQSILSKDTSFSSFLSIQRRLDLKGNSKGVLQGLISTGIYSLIFAG